MQEYNPLRNVRQNIALAHLDIGAGKYPLPNAVHLDINPEVCPDVNGSVLSMPFPDERFDMITALEILEHLHRPELFQALAEIHRVMKPGGRLVITIPNFTAVMQIPQNIVWFVREHTTQVMYHNNKYTHTHIGLVQPLQLKQLLRRFGFIVVYSRRIMLYDYLIVCVKP